MSSVYRIGCDVGQRVDHSAVCVVEEQENGVAIVRFILKYPLGFGYPKLVETLAELYYSVAKKGEVRSFTIDATGVGMAPSQMLQEAIQNIRIDPFIFSNKTKRELVGKVKVMHSMGKLKFARRKGDEAYNRDLDGLITEMKQVQAKVIREDATSPEIEIFKTGTHDDLFTALALAINDIPLTGGGMEGAVSFVEDKTWLRTPLDEEGSQGQILFF